MAAADLLASCGMCRTVMYSILGLKFRSFGEVYMNRAVYIEITYGRMGNL